MSITPELKQAVGNAYRALKAGVPGFKERDAQKTMITAIASALSRPDDGTRLVATEAPTGVGKSLGYLLGALPAAMAQGKYLVVATATVTLQEQLLKQDLPAFHEHAGIEFGYKLAKGRGRYACPLAISHLTGHDTDQMGLGLGDDGAAAWPFAPSPADVRTVNELERSLQDQSWDGDIDALPEPLDPKLIPLVTTTRHKCTNRGCPHFAVCPFFAARDGLKEQNVIVANHDLVLSGLDMEGGPLPAPEECIYVFDEGHHLGEKAIQHFASEVRLLAATKALPPAAKLIQNVGGMLAGVADATQPVGEFIAGVPKLVQAIKDVHQAVAEFHQHLPGDPAQPFAPRRFPTGCVPEPLPNLARIAHARAANLSSHLGVIIRAFRQAAKDGAIGPAQANRALPALGSVMERIDEWKMLFSRYLEDDPVDRAPVARWLMAVQDGQHVDFELCAVPITVAGLLHAALWTRCHGAVVASATLTAMGSFKRLRDATGLPADALTVSLPSPFNLPELAVLSVPDLGVDPTDPVLHTELVATFLNKELDRDGASLVLFASNRQMQEVFGLLDHGLQDKVLMQRTLAKHEILARHKAAVDAQQGSVIFGLASFAEGVDLRGKYCTHVVITKIPFAVPDDPIAATRAEWLERQGRKPFFELTLPDACQRLVQWCGRLVRSETDTGCITILDRRLLTKRYGEQMVEHLPPYRRELGWEPKWARRRLANSAA